MSDSYIHLYGGAALECMIINQRGRVAIGGPALGFRFEMALLYAFRLHAEQCRKGSNTPYFAHLLALLRRSSRPEAMRIREMDIGSLIVLVDELGEVVTRIERLAKEQRRTRTNYSAG
jgi:hypothetical protein